jgi:hypothetical protein
MKQPPWTLPAPLRCFFLDPEGALHAAMVVDPVPERPVMRFEVVAGPGPPAGEFAFGTDMQIGAVEECSFDEVIQADRSWFEGFSP